MLACKDDIRRTLFKYKEELASAKSHRNVDFRTLLEFTHNLSYTNHAPADWVPGAPLIKCHPPAPQPQEMRGGMLEKYNLSIQALSTKNLVDGQTEKVPLNESAKALANSILNFKSSLGKRGSEDAEATTNEMDTEQSAEEEARAEEVAASSAAKNRKLNISFGSYSDDEDSD